MRFFPALSGALLITVAIFLFMQSLIEPGKEERAQLVVHTDVEILRPKAEEPEPEEDAPEKPPEEPVMDVMDVMAARPPTPQPPPQRGKTHQDRGGGARKKSMRRLTPSL